MSTQTITSLRLTRVIAADPERVFEAWTEPRHMMSWACPEGAVLEAVEVDLRVGGPYRLRMRNAEGQVHTAHGTYREIEPPSRLVYTWEWEEEEMQVGETTVTVEFRDLGGSTEVRLTHAAFPAAEATAAHEEGWSSCLNRFERLFA